MRRSAGMGGGRVLRAVGRAVGSGVAGVKDVVSGTTGNRAAMPARVAALSSRSGSSSAAVVAAATRGSALYLCDGEEWETIEGEDEEVEMEERFERFVFGPVPTTQEAEEAVSSIQQMFIPVPFGEIIERSPHEQEEVKDKAVTSTTTKILPRSLSAESQSDWIEPVMHLYSSKNCQSREREKVLDAFRLLQMNPSIQKVVVSLSSDRAVWDAVMKNEVVQEFKKSFYEAESKSQDPNEEDAHPVNGILKWIADAKAKIMEVLDKIAKHLSQIFHSHGAKDELDIFDHVLQSSFMLSVLVFIVVVMNRVQQS
ncbi:uncharacterized protein LOC110095289 isoform X2 [Dendrobium catenatum]|uniref:uncharacterized protein LOC110095289 isoform X2 n=1 Tax=Dendrobium catenatum TaxID=906689 RepID=UPI0010A04962|nr:uncharacterized protein LOC110095289 isoform X2 [Dendrobium catenatum]